MPAGESARGEARRSSESAARYRKKAENADRRAANFEAGAAGEVALHAVLVRLVHRGWRPIPDRRSPWGGNMDELLVGPAGVAVVDSKAWSQAVRVQGGHLYAARYRRTTAVDGVLRQVDAVAKALGEGPHGSVAVRGFIALTGCDHARPPEEVRGVRVAGLDHLEPGFSRLPTLHSPRTVADVSATLEGAFPSCSDLPDVAEPLSPAPLHVSGDIRLFYVRPWKQCRLYLKDAEGDELGWKDVRTGSVCVGSAERDAPVVHAILQASSLSGMRLSAEDLPLPRLPPGPTARQLLGHAKASPGSILIGMESQGRGTHRLYGTCLVPGVGTFPLGHVDLRNGKRFASVLGRLAPHLEPADSYLGLLWERWPGRRRARDARRSS